MAAACQRCAKAFCCKAGSKSTRMKASVATRRIRVATASRGNIRTGRGSVLRRSKYASTVAAIPSWVAKPWAISNRPDQIKPLVVSQWLLTEAKGLFVVFLPGKPPLAVFIRVTVIAKPHQASKKPRFIAISTACVRSFACNLPMMLFIWPLDGVFTNLQCVGNGLLEQPVATQRSTSTSLEESLSASKCSARS